MTPYLSVPAFLCLTCPYTHVHTCTHIIYTYTCMCEHTLHYPLCSLGVFCTICLGSHSHQGFLNLLTQTSHGQILPISHIPWYPAHCSADRVLKGSVGAQMIISTCFPLHSLPSYQEPLADSSPCSKQESEGSNELRIWEIRSGPVLAENQTNVRFGL